MASSREIVREAFALKKPARVPVGICLGGSWPICREGYTLQSLLADAKQAARVFYEVNAGLGADFITVGSGATALLIEALGGEIRFNKKGAPEIISLLVRSEEDIDRLDIGAVLRAPRVQWLKEIAIEMVRLNREEKSIFVSGRAPFTLAGQIFGLENLSKALYKNKSLVHKLLHFTTELSAAYFEEMLTVDGLDGIFIADPTASGDVVSIPHFETYVLPYLTKVLGRLRPYDKLSMLHICGNTTNRLHLLPPTGIQFVSVDAKVDIKEAKEILQGKIGLAGNVDPVAVLEEETADTVFLRTMECLDNAAPGGGFLLLPGCDLSTRVPEKNVLAFVDAAERWNDAHRA